MNDLDFFSDTCPLAVIEWSRGLRVTRWSRAAESIFGWKADEVLGLHAAEWQFTHADDLPQVKRAMGRLIGGKVESTEVIGRYFNRNGQILYCHWRTHACRDARGRLRSLVSFATDVTQLKQAEHALRSSEERYASIFSNSHAVMLIIDPTNDSIVDVNPAAERFYGWSRGELTQMRIGDINTLAPEQLKTETRRARDGKCSRFLFQHRRADGSVRDVEVFSGPIVQDGRPLLFSIIHDITERRLAEEKMRRWERFYQEAQLGIAMHDARSNTILEANPAYAAAHGYEVDEIRGVRIKDLYSPEERPKLDERLAQADHMGHLTFESVHQDRHGKPIPVIIGITSINDDSGECVARYVFMIDIGARKAAEARLRILSRAIEESPESIVITNTHAEIEYVNPAFEQRSGYSASEVIGRNPRVLHSGKTAIETYDSLWQALTAGKSWAGEFHNRRKDGSEYLERALITPIHDDQGTITHYVGVKEDITERRRLETELLRHKEHLESLVESRTLELSHALEAAQAANRAKSDFLATMSHEIRTPMNGVLGLADVLGNTSLNPDQADIVGTMRDSAHILLRLIDDILDFSKIESGHLEIARESVDLAELVEGVGDKLQPTALKQGVSLRLFVDPLLPAAIRSDSLRIAQILTNLVGNAIKFSSALKRRGRVDVRAERDGDDRARLSVTDNGIGIPAQAIDHIFRPFSQAESSTTRRFGGTGLGLSISRQLIELLGGSISVDSKQGVGSSFVVTLPMTVEADTTPRVCLRLDGTHCVIVAEDTRDARTWARYLTHCGASVQECVTLPDALAHIAAQPLGNHVLITDHGLTPALRTRWHALASTHRPGLILMSEGLRRQARLEETRTVSLDIDAMRRDSLIEAVHLASERHDSVLRCTVRRSPAAGSAAPIISIRQQPPILVAEDNEINRKVLGRQLDLLGLSYEMAFDGEQAFDRWQHGRYALLLTDLHMPEVDGYMLTERIRKAEPAGQRFPIIAVTANALRGEDRRCEAAGMDDYIVKPVQLDELRRVILRWLPTTGPAAEGTTGEPRDALTGAPDHLDSPTIVTSRPPPLTKAPEPPPDIAQSRTPPTAKLPILDIEVLASLIGHDDALINDFLNEYRTSASKAAEEIRQARQATNWRAVGDVAHRLKSASRSVGALRMGELFAALEHAGRNHDQARLVPLLKIFEPALAQTLLAIDERMGRP